MPPTLPQSLINLIGEYGLARTDGVGEIERLYRWELLIAGIKDYAREYVLADRRQRAAGQDEAIGVLRELVACKDLRARANAISPVEPGFEKEVLNDELRRRDLVAWGCARTLTGGLGEGGQA